MWANYRLGMTKLNTKEALCKNLRLWIHWKSNLLCVSRVSSKESWKASLIMNEVLMSDYLCEQSKQAPPQGLKYLRSLIIKIIKSKSNHISEFGKTWNFGPHPLSQNSLSFELWTFRFMVLIPAPFGIFPFSVTFFYCIPKSISAVVVEGRMVLWVKAS